MNRLQAFTLVELLVVIGIIALLISILLPSLSKAREQSRSVACLANMHQIAVACMNYAVDNNGAIVPAQWESTAANPLPDDKTLYGDEAWCNILVNGGYAQAPDASAGWTKNPGPERRSVFYCPSGNDSFIDAAIINNGGVPKNRIDDTGAECARYYSLSTRTSVDCWYGINGDDTPDPTIGCPCRRMGIDYGQVPTKLTAVRRTAEMVFFFDGLYLDHTRVNANRINARHNAKTRTNIAYFDGHVDSVNTDTQIPGGLRNATANDFILSNLQAKYPPPANPMWLLEQQD